ncbi:hypothetical protein FKP32DRAFT_31742 [Trametes sanguinea]|nr:hypothetical protein FKP32DRAFT_31742 [Trametes sanguinea]
MLVFKRGRVEKTCDSAKGERFGGVGDVWRAAGTRRSGASALQAGSVGCTRAVGRSVTASAPASARVFQIDCEMREISAEGYRGNLMRKIRARTAGRIYGAPSLWWQSGLWRRVVVWGRNEPTHASGGGEAIGRLGGGRRAAACQLVVAEKGVCAAGRKFTEAVGVDAMWSEGWSMERCEGASRWRDGEQSCHLRNGEEDGKTAFADAPNHSRSTSLRRGCASLRSIPGAGSGAHSLNSAGVALSYSTGIDGV